MNSSLINKDLIYYIQSIIVRIKGKRVEEEEVIKIIDIIPENILEIWEGYGSKCSVFTDEVYDIVLKVYLNK